MLIFNPDWKTCNGFPVFAGLISAEKTKLEKHFGALEAATSSKGSFVRQ